MRKVLRRPDFRLLFFGLLTAMAGESILILTLAIWVKEVTGSNGMAGATILAIIAPMVLAPVLGWVVDRFRRRMFLVAVNLASVAVVMPLLAVRDREDIWIIYVVAALYGLSYVVTNAALNGLLKQIVPNELLADANGVLQTVKQGLRLVGPLVGAALYTAVGGWVVAVVAATGFATAAVAVAALRIREEPPGRPELRWLGEVAAGVRHALAHRALRRMMAVTFVAMLVVGPTESLIFAFVDRGLHQVPGFVGVLVSVQGVGALAGGLVAATMVHKVGELAATAIGLLLFVPSELIFATSEPGLVWVFVAMALCGAGLPVVIVGCNTLIQRCSPADLLGRVTAATDAIVSGPLALSIGAGAVLVTLVDYQVLYVIIGVLMTAAGFFLWQSRRLSPARATRVPVVEGIAVHDDAVRVAEASQPTR